jgi:hypothetical protein
MKPLKVYTKTKDNKTTARIIVEKKYWTTHMPYLNAQDNDGLYFTVLEKMKKEESTATCSNTDIFNEKTGMKLARTRLFLKYFDTLDQTAELEIQQLKREIQKLETLRTVAKKKKDKIRNAIKHIYKSVEEKK